MNTVRDSIIYYFSGTGNSKQIALWLAEAALEKGVDCRVVDITSVASPDALEIKKESLLTIVSPTHGFNYPPITIRFIRKLPKGNNRVVLTNTRGGVKIGHFITPGLSGITFMLSTLLLIHKGYKIRGLISFDMPSNWLSIHPALNAQSVNYIFQTAQRKVQRYADKLLAGKPVFPALRDLIQDVLISPVAIGYYLAGRFFLAKSFYASDKCTSCGLCEKNCPLHAIKKSHKHPFWTFKCESCMRCMNACPYEAIQTTHGLWIVLFGLTFFIMGLFHTILADYYQSFFVRLVLFTLVMVALAAILYRVQYLLIKNKRINAVITYASLTFYKFWGRCRYKSEKKSE